MKYLAATCLTLAAAPAMAQDFTAAIEDYYNSQISAWADASILIEAINAQNQSTGGYGQSQIDALDQAWRAEVGQTDTPTISPVLTSAASDFLREQVEASGGQITEVFIMDSNGLNVAASAVTSDYWQGDEAKFTETYAAGPGGFHVSEIELDD